MEFLKSSRRFSFLYGGKNICDSKHTVSVDETDISLKTTYIFEDGLKVVNEARKYSDFGAYEWVNYFENTGSAPTEIISELWDCDISLPMEHESERKWETNFPDASTATKIYSPSGSTWTKKEFYCNVDEIVENVRVNHIYPGKTKRYKTSTGRSSEEKAPFFNVHKNGMGYIFAIGWTGQWSAEVSRSCDDITFRSRITDTNFTILPGESFRTSSIVVLPYRCNYESSQNLWRRLLKKHYSPIGKHPSREFAPLSAMLWGGMTEPVTWSWRRMLVVI